MYFGLGFAITTHHHLPSLIFTKLFKNPFSFSGRIRRTEYGLSYLLYMVALIFIQLLFPPEESTINALIILITYVPLLWFLLAQGAKRCHDRGNNGWYQMIPFYFFWLVFAEGEDEKNQYGPNPKTVRPAASIME